MKKGSYIDTIRRVMDGDFTASSEEEKEEATKDVIQMCAAAAAAVTIQPIPFMDTALLAPIQIAMVQAIGRVHGHSLDKKSVLEMLSTFGASIVAQNVIIAASKFVPFLGWAVSISMSFALTYAIGEVSDHYFKSGRGVSPTELKEMFSRVNKEKKAQKEAEHSSNDTLKQRLKQLSDAHKDGLLTEEEFAAKKEEMLSDF